MCSEKHPNNNARGWIRALETCVAKSSSVKGNLDKETQKHVDLIFEERRKKQLQKTPSLRHIPRFYKKPTSVPASGSGGRREELIRMKLHQEARSLFLAFKEEELMEYEDLSLVVEALSSSLGSRGPKGGSVPQVSPPDGPRGGSGGGDGAQVETGG
ncbi:unnamed protein product, partial [Discosporangium mesarthrocarpum]